jgi:hypothetical protein
MGVDGSRLGRAAAACATLLPDSVHEISPDLEGIGTVRAYFVDVGDLDDSFPPLPAPSWRGRLGRTVAAAGLGLPYMLGLRRPRRAMSRR